MAAEKVNKVKDQSVMDSSSYGENQVDLPRIRGSDSHGAGAGAVYPNVHRSGVQNPVRLDDSDFADRRSYSGQQAVLRLAHAVSRTLPARNIRRRSAATWWCLFFPEDRSKDFIKRVIGVAGDTVEVRAKKVFINGKQVDDPHAHFRRLRSAGRARLGAATITGRKSCRRIISSSWATIAIAVTTAVFGVTSI